MFPSLFKLSSLRVIFIGLGIFCFLVIGYSYYIQIIKNIPPCPLCIIQRGIYVIIGAIACLAAINNKNYRIYAIFILGFTLLGLKIAKHHIWLQNLPIDQRPSSCLMPLSILYDKLPLLKFIKLILNGSAECTLVTWQIMGVPAPLASTYAYILIGIVTIYILIASERSSRRS